MRTRLALAAGMAAALLVSAALADGTWLGTSVCTATPNSTGGAAAMGVFGPDHGGSGQVFLDDPVVLSATPVPAGTYGLFFFGQTATQTPFGNGLRCVAEPALRLPVTVAGSFGGGVLEQNFTFARHPAFTAGTWYFQAIFRDTAAGGAGFDTSDSIELVISP